MELTIKIMTHQAKYDFASVRKKLDLTNLEDVELLTRAMKEGATFKIWRIGSITKETDGTVKINELEFEEI